MRDGVGREISYLRISVTDRCNFRCLYCMPLAGLPWLARAELLTDAEIVAVVQQLVPLGLRRLRITGGEPTLRLGLEALIAALRGVHGVEEIALSTNGVHLVARAAALRAAGVARVNVSVDSLRAERIQAIARRATAFDPLAALDAALAAGLSPVKVNVVVLRGVNDDEVGALAALAATRPVHVRFIELMPVGSLAGATESHLVPAAEILDRVRGEVGPLQPLGPAEGPAGNGPARYQRAPGMVGTIGVITPMTHTYCGACNRVRVTADGRLRACLFGDHEVDLRTPLRAGRPLAALVAQALREKPVAHALLERRTGALAALSQTGG